MLARTRLLCARLPRRGLSSQPPAQTRLGEKELQALEKELRETLIQRKNQFTDWKARNTVKFLVAGGIGGAALITTASGVYVYRNPRIVEWAVSRVAVAAFDHASSYEGRLAVYLGLPEPDVPLESLEAETLKLISKSWGDDGIAHGSDYEAGILWASQVIDAFGTLDSSLLLSTKS